MSLGDFFSKIDQGARKVQMPYLKHLGSMAKDPEQAWRLAMPGDNETTKLTNQVFAREDKPWQGSFSEGLGLPSWYKDEVRARGDDKALGYDHQVKGAVGAVTGAYLGAGAYNAAAGGAAGSSGAAGGSGGAAGGSGSGASTSGGSGVPWGKIASAAMQGMRGGGGGAQAEPEPDYAEEFRDKELAAQREQQASQAQADKATQQLQGASEEFMSSLGKGFRQTFGRSKA